MPQAVHAANDRFARGFNCAQSVLAAFAERYDLPAETALRIAASFGAGMARAGEVCGALTGALMVLGLQYGSDHPEGKEEMYRLAREFMEQFEARHGSMLCKQIIGYDISMAEGLQAAREQNLFASICPAVVDATARALNEYLLTHLSAG